MAHRPRESSIVLRDPESRFGSPEALLGDLALPREEKIRILHQWQYDQLEIAVAQGEGMDGPEPTLLRRVRSALRALGAADAITTRRD